MSPLETAAAAFRSADRAWRIARKATAAAPKDDETALGIEIDAHCVRQGAIRDLLRAAKGP
jgi:hypothetical protein